MELSDLHIFRTIVQSCGMAKAASQLHRVQSNVSTRIKNLEKDLGVTLFFREGRGLQLSPAGQLLLDYTERLLSLAEEVREALQDRTPRGILRLGAMESTAAAHLPAALSEFHLRYPEVALELRTGATRQLVNQVIAGELDAALVAGPVADSRLDQADIYEEELVIIAESGHRPIGSPGDVRKRTLLAFQPGCAYRKRLDAWFSREGLLPERIVELSSHHAILGCVAAGMGISSAT